MKLLWHERRSRGRHEHNARGPCLGSSRLEVAPGAQELSRTFDRVRQQASEDDARVVHSKLEGGGDAEVAAATAHAPEQVLVLRFARADDGAVGGYDVDRDQVVAGEAMLADKPAEAAAELTSAQVSPASTRAVRPFRSTQIPFMRQVEDEAALADGAAADVVAAAADGDLQAVAPGKVHCLDHVCDAGTARDQRRPPIDHRVEDRPRLVVAGVGGAHELSAKRPLDLLNVRLVERDLLGEYHLRTQLLPPPPVTESVSFQRELCQGTSSTASPTSS